MSSIDPADAPWPDRENLPSKAEPTAPGTPATSDTPAAPTTPADSTGSGSSGPDQPAGKPSDSARDENNGQPDAHGPAERGRVIRPAGLARPADPPAEADPPVGAGPRDYELDQPRDGDLDSEWDRYVPPPLPPQPKLDPVAKGAWIALFGGPGYLMLATLLSWEIPGWGALTAVAAFVTGFVILVIRLGDGPSKRDGPDQGAVV